MEMLAKTAAAMTRLGRAGLIVLLRQRAPMGRASRRRVDCTIEPKRDSLQNRQEEPSERGRWRSWSRSRQTRDLSGGGLVRASVIRVDRAALRAAQVNSAESGHQKSSSRECSEARGKSRALLSTKSLRTAARYCCALLHLQELRGGRDVKKC